MTKSKFDNAYADRHSLHGLGLSQIFVAITVSHVWLCVINLTDERVKVMEGRQGRLQEKPLVENCKRLAPDSQAKGSSFYHSAFDAEFMSAIPTRTGESLTEAVVPSQPVNTVLDTSTGFWLQ